MASSSPVIVLYESPQQRPSRRQTGSNPNGHLAVSADELDMIGNDNLSDMQFCKVQV